ncbi:LytTR family transcriptional regulator DNA-binding domain-containing protein [Paenibacillus tarimensis]
MATDEIDFIQYVKPSDRVFVFTQSNEEYCVPGPLKYWLKALQNSGCEFEQVDRNIAVNLRNIKLLDKQYKLAYFEAKPGSNSKNCTISFGNFNKVLEKVLQINPSVIVTNQVGSL